jgi:lipopolysaccharide transport system ATP-binding protein
MTDTVISVENISKKFCRSLKRSLWYGVQDLGSDIVGFRKERNGLRPEEFWALKDVSFDVNQGDTIGLIGRNGSGKTTLLKLLSGLINLDQGRITVRGHIQALIALGAGFNPVLTGKENIYVNAAILGLSKTEVNLKFDEIVDFSGIGNFIDAPVQSYSSGMAVRLGFSVAVHMNPDILLLDEILAVGDIPFRAKCHKKLGELKDKGIPWIMVSHDMGIIRNQTNRAIYLDDGKIKFIGGPEETINQYLYSISNSDYQNNLAEQNKISNHLTGNPREVEVGKVKLLDSNFQEKDQFVTDEPLIIEINYVAHQIVENPSFGFYINGGDGLCYVGTNTLIDRYSIENISGYGKIYYKIEHLPLLPGIYKIRVDIWDNNMGMTDKKNDAAYLHVTGGNFSPGMFSVNGTWIKA